MRRTLASALAALSLATLALEPVAFAAEPPPAAAPEGVDPTQLVGAVDIPYERFVLDNGLTVLVHTDRKAPIVGVTTYYRVGSKHEPRGKTGFAHLYEHLFFGGSPNAPSFDAPLEAVGGSNNGSTWLDRTNYVETVPTGAVDLALFLESDRMGYILPAVTQDKLDKQRGVVQNEKRQGDNQPYGLMSYAESEGLFPVGHPYRHSTIGSMADLDAATLGDVRNWFRDHYAPNNVVLVLSGDIDAATARPKVEKWFGAIPSGPKVAPVEAGPVTLAAPKSREMTDRVPLIRLSRNWTGPGLNAPDANALEVGMHILGGLASSRLDNVLVRGQELAVAVTASAQTFEGASYLQATMDVKPGVDRTVAEAAFEKVIADYLREGPTEDEVRRAVMSTLSSEIGALEVVGGFYGKGATLAEGELYSGDPAKYKKDLAEIAALTPERIKTALNKWLSRPVYELDVIPGERTEDGATMGGWGDEGTTPPPPPDPRAEPAPLPPAPERTMPSVTPVAELDFPEVQHFTLSNGIPVAFARRTAVPKAIVALDFAAGYAADTLDTPGTQSIMLGLLEEGTSKLDATQIAEAQERLGASINFSGSVDTSSVTLSTLTANLEPSLDLMATLVLDPAFRPEDVARVKQQALAQLASAKATPNRLAYRSLMPILFGSHPYAQPSDGLGDAESLAALTPEALRKAHDKWLRPDLARITVVGDLTAEQLKPLLEDAFGGWKAPKSPAPKLDLAATVPTPSPRIVLLDRPDSPQSVIFAGRVLPIEGTTKGTETIELANQVIGDGLLSRLNADLREDKGWSYGVYSFITSSTGPRTFAVIAPVQADKTGESIAAVISDLRALPASRPVSDEELQRVTEGSILSLPDQLETNSAVASAIRVNTRLGRPDDYYETLAQTYRAADKASLDAAASEYLKPDQLTFVVVGDRSVVEPQLKSLGLPVEVREGEAPDDAGSADEPAAEPAETGE
ncbi:peptidase M16 [Novosphingobium sp. PC22D]|uniref:M16 family metallopeptidase n=1 Tax=Novosphingobium sp. PC22D TaxID=1962403 RepID=UPI000BEFA9D2|nr:pitrilysin family protein [Novosphingobium sp. PC22D]PEQ13953.1 peptidase M16 [Novosphingobium sp. PC22D]